MISKKTISPVVATALLLVVAVVAVVGFQNWFQTYSSSVFVDTEIKSNGAASGQLNIEGVIGGILYVVNNVGDNLSVNTLKIGGVECSLPSNLILGINEVDVSSCLSQISDTAPDVFIATDSVVTTEYVVVKGSLPDPLCNNLVALYHFDNNSAYGENNTYLYDFSGNGNTGNCSGSNCPTFNSTGGKFGGAFDFDGSNDYFAIAHDDSFLIRNGTIVAWIYPHDNDSLQSFISKDSDSFDTGGHFGVLLNIDGQLRCRLQQTSSDVNMNSPVGVVQINSWQHVTMTFGEGGLNLYHNGLRVANDSITTGTETSSGGIGNYEPMAIGAGTGSSGNLVITPIGTVYEGLIDEVMFFNRSLSVSEIESLYSSSSPLNC